MGAVSIYGKCTSWQAIARNGLRLSPEKPFAQTPPDVHGGMA